MKVTRRAVLVVLALVLATLVLVVVAGPGLSNSMDVTAAESYDSSYTVRDGGADSRTAAQSSTPTPEEPRVAPEREDSDEYGEEEYENFDESDSNVTTFDPEIDPPMQALRYTYPSANGSNTPGRGYDAELQWEQAGPTGFGFYSSVDLVGVGPDAEYTPESVPVIKGDETVLAVAGGSGRGGLWRKDTSSGTGWENVGRNLDAPFRIIDAALDPDDGDHAFVITAAEENDRLAMYETTDGGETWDEVSYFADQQPLVDDRNGYKASRKGATVRFLENDNVFVYNFDRNNYAYYSTDGGITWSPSSISVSGASEPGARNKVYFSDNGNGLLNPSGGDVYRTTDYGQSWTRVANYGSAESFSFGLSGDGQTIYAVYKTSQTCCMMDKSTDGGQSFTTSGPIDDFPSRGPQGLTVDPDDSDRVTVFIYMQGPYESRDGGDSWDWLHYGNQLKVGHHYFYDTKQIKKNDPPEDSMAKPVDYRDVMVLNELDGNPILVGSDQGLFILSRGTTTNGPVEWLNIGAMMDNSEVYGVEVDDCGNLYHGLWHESTMIRTATNPGQSFDELYYYGGGETGSMTLKDSSDCLGWATKHSAWLGTYVSDKSGELRKYDTGVDEIKYVDRPAHVGGEWFYTNGSNWNLYSTTLSNHPSSRSQQDSNARRPKKDDSTDTLWYATGYSHVAGQPENAWNPHPRKLKELSGPSGSPTTHLDFTGSNLGIDLHNRHDRPRYDVADERAVVVVEDSTTNEEDVVIFDPTAPGTLTASDVSVSNPFDGKNIGDVFVDPTDPDRYYAMVLDRGDPECPYHLMVTEDSGDSWELFSEYLDCSNIYDMAFHEDSGTVYVATHARGVLKGNIGNLDDTTDLSLSMQCEDQAVVREAVDCELHFGVDGQPKNEWQIATNSVSTNIWLPFDGYRYTLGPYDGTPIRDANCFERTETDDHGNRKVDHLECASSLDNFPRSDGFPLRFQLHQKYDATYPGDAPVAAEVVVNNGPQDLKVSNNEVSTTIEIHKAKPDRFDPHTEDGEIVSNDNITSPANVTDWTHDRADHHLACPEDPQYQGGDDIVDQLEANGQNCATVLSNPSGDAPLSAHEVWTQEVTDLSLWSATEEDYYNVSLPTQDSMLMQDKLDHTECGTTQVEMQQSGSREHDPKKSTATPKPGGGGGTQSDTVTKTVETEGWLEVTIRPASNQHSQVGVDTEDLDIRAYPSADETASTVSAATTQSGDAVTMRIDCPRSQEGLSKAIMALGEQDLAAGGYTMELTYRIDITRPDDIQARGTPTDSSAPGFGIGVAVVSLLSIALLARRRR